MELATYEGDCTAHTPGCVQDTDITGSLANSITKLGYEFEWIKNVADFDKAEVGGLEILTLEQEN